MISREAMKHICRALTGLKNPYYLEYEENFITYTNWHDNIVKSSVMLDIHELSVDFEKISCLCTLSDFELKVEHFGNDWIRLNIRYLYCHTDTIITLLKLYGCP